MKKMLLTILGIVAFPAIAFAHPGHEMANFASGFIHPFTGIDHLLVMLAVGYWAGKSQSSARWQVPGPLHQAESGPYSHPLSVLPSVTVRTSGLGLIGTPLPARYLLASFMRWIP